MGVTEQTYWQPLVKVMSQRWCSLSKGRTTQPSRTQATTYLLSVVMPVVCWYTGIQPPSFFDLRCNSGESGRWSFFLHQYFLL